MPEDRFTFVARFEHRCDLAAGFASKVEERIFIPKHQISTPPSET